MSLGDYLPIAVMAVLALAFAAGSRLLSNLLHPKAPSPEKLEPYECGIIPEREPAERFPVQFYLVAMLFVAFDIEIIFLYPWGVLQRQLEWFGLAAMGIFLAILTIAYVVEWREGMLDWAPQRRYTKEALLRQAAREVDAARVASTSARPTDAPEAA
jgi:NADH-quinone oxidoreductase subunit A